MAGLSKNYGYWTDKEKADYMAEYYRLNSEALKAKARENYRANAAVFAARYHANRAKVLSRQRAKREGSSGAQMQRDARKRYKANPAPAVARANKRRAIRQKAAVGTDRAAYRAYVKGVQEAEVISCRWCQKHVAKAERRIDHIVPLSKGGADAVDNLCCACRLCNARKAAKLPEEWVKTPLQAIRRQLER